MKRLSFFIGLLVSLLFPMFSSADNILGNTWSTPISVKASFAIPDQLKIQNIGLMFCDEQIKNFSKKNIITIRPWETKEICAVFYNSSSGDVIDISSSFVDAETDADGKFICSLGSNTWKSLASHISFNPNDYIFSLKPQEKIVKKAKVTIPQNMTWTLRGCLWYQLNIKKPDNYTGLFFVVRRSVGVMEVNITWDIYDFGRWDDIKYTYKDHQMFILNSIARFLWVLLLYLIIISTKAKKKEKHSKKK